MTSPIVPRPNDILLGRGSGPNLFQGNRRFRDLVAERRRDYIEADKHMDKKRIAQELLEHVHSTGGRFLQLTEEGRREGTNIVDDGCWRLAPTEVALEKCKQSLREKKIPKQRPKKKKKKKKQKSSAQEDAKEGESGDSGVTEEVASSTSAEPLGVEPSNPAAACLPSSPIPLLPSSLPIFQQAAIPSIHPFQFAQGHPAINQMNAPMLPSTPLVCFNLHPAAGISSEPLMTFLSRHEQPVAPIPVPEPVQSVETGRTEPQAAQDTIPGTVSEPVPPPARSVENGRDEASDKTFANPYGENERTEREVYLDSTIGSSQHTFAPHEDFLFANAEEDVSHILNIMSLSNREIITEEQEEEERNKLTDEERAAVLADMFGEMCTIGSHQHKKARRDLDSDSIEFLIGQMKLALDQIPSNKKQDLLEAQRKAHPDEFNDERLLMFLRCEGMNAKLAAERFVKYWEARRDAFGPSKFVERLTLSEALRDDGAALEAGVYCLLPLPDMSGRKLLYWEPHRHTRRYTSESLRRAIWYTIEVAAQETTDIGSGIVQVHWEVDTTLWDYDSKEHDCIANCLKTCWPVKMISSHICCPPSIPVRFLKPIIHALLGKDMRSRVQLHDVPKSDIAQVLEGFGINKEMLPTHMGGKIAMDPKAWIENRRAVEMEMEAI